jgi:hypothetical protein
VCSDDGRDVAAFDGRLLVVAAASGGHGRLRVEELQSDNTFRIVGNHVVWVSPNDVQ